MRSTSCENIYTKVSFSHCTHFRWEINRNDQLGRFLRRKSLSLITDLLTQLLLSYIVHKKGSIIFRGEKKHARLKMHFASIALCFYTPKFKMPARDKRLQNLILLARVIFIKSNMMKFSDESRDWIKDESRGTTESKRKKVGEREKAIEVKR